MLDRFDKVQTLINPESEYVQRQVSALMRKKDIEFITGALGTAGTGKGGATPANLGSVKKLLTETQVLQSPRFVKPVLSCKRMVLILMIH